MKQGASKDFIAGLKSIDPALVKQAVGGARFQQAFFDNAQDAEIVAYVKGVLGQ